MIKNIDCFILLKQKQQKFQNFIDNRKKEKRIKSKTKKIINLQNKDNTLYFNKIDKVYKLENLHSKINWVRYYLELYLNDLFLKYENIQNNKINLK